MKRLLHTRANIAVIVLLAFAGTLTPVDAQERPATPLPPAAPNPRPAAVGADAGQTGYVIGPEDVLGVVFWRDTEMTGDVTVRPDGRITLPLIGEIQAAGLTSEALSKQIQAASTKFLTDANVQVIVRQINSRKIYITGNVTTPGSYPLIGPRTVLQLIALAGGLTEFADAENITIMRTQGGKTVSHRFNYKDVSKGRKLEQNLTLEPGDTVVVP